VQKFDEFRTNIHGLKRFETFKGFKMSFYKFKINIFFLKMYLKVRHLI